MRIWKIISGVLSIAAGLLTAYQSYFVSPPDNALLPAAGLAAAALLFIAGIIAIASSRGSMGADIVLISLYGVGALVGFTLTGLLLISLWCLLCAVLALVSFLLLYFEDDEPSAGAASTARSPAVPTLRTLLFERNQHRRDAAVDALPEFAAKSYLKQLLTAFIRRESITALPEPEPEAPPSRQLRPGAVLAVIVVLAAAGAVFFLFGRGSLTDKTNPGSPSSAAQSPQPSPKSDAPTSTPADRSGALGDYYVEIQDAFLAEDYQGHPAIVITYQWTNNSDQTTNAMSVLLENAYQNGVQMDGAIVVSTPGYQSGTSIRNLRPGTSASVHRAFLLSDASSPVEFEVSEFIRSSGDVLSAVFDPAELSSPQ